MRFFPLIILCFLLSCTKQEGLNVSDYPIIPSATDLANYYGFQFDTTGQSESTTISHFLDGSKDLDYTYELLDTEEYTPLFYNISVSEERSVKDAKASYDVIKTSMSLGSQITDQKEEEIDSLNLPFDESYYSLRSFNNVPNGHIFIAREGSRIYTLIVSGIYSTDHSLLTDLVLPRIQNLGTYKVP